MSVYPPIDVPTRLSTVAGPLIESVKAFDFFEMCSKPIEIKHID
jgi:hypothetical protein